MRIPRFEEWTTAPDELIAKSRGHYDQAEYDLRLKRGIGTANWPDLAVARILRAAQYEDGRSAAAWWYSLPSY